MRYYVISDVHGYYTQMKSALEKAGFFSDTTPHKLIMLGDLFDRGHEAKQLQQFILEQMEQDKIILIRGNHEDLFVELVTTDAGMPYSYHKSNGTYDMSNSLATVHPELIAKWSDRNLPLTLDNTIRFGKYALFIYLHL